MSMLRDILDLLSANKRGWSRAWSGYMIPYLPILNGVSNSPGSVTTQDGADFILTRIGVQVATTANPNVEVAAPQLTFLAFIGSLKLFPDDNAQHVGPYVMNTSDRRGHYLEFPQLVPGNTTLKVTLTNLAAADQNVRFHFWGLRMWDSARGSKDL